MTREKETSLSKTRRAISTFIGSRPTFSFGCIIYGTVDADEIARAEGRPRAEVRQSRQEPRRLDRSSCHTVRGRETRA